MVPQAFKFDLQDNTLRGLSAWLSMTPTITTYRVNLLRTTVASFKLQIEKLLSSKYERPPKVFAIKEIPEVICIAKLQTTARKENDNSKEVIVDSCCAAALLRGAHIYAPGVLAMQTGTKFGEDVQVYADLDGKCKKGTNTRYEAPNKLFIGLGRVHMQRHKLFGVNTLQQTGVAVEMLNTFSAVPTLGDLSSKEALLQNLPSIVCVRVLQPQPGERILDMCAAPGNKTTHIAEMMRDEGTVVALDKTEAKVKYIRDKCAQNELKCVHAFAFDATKSWIDGVNANNTERHQPPYTANSFDRILLDAPCSALGNRPVLASRMTTKMLTSYPNVQRKLLSNAVLLLKPGGVLVYSTCTVTIAENEQMVAWVLQKFPCMQLVDATPRLGGMGLPSAGLSTEQSMLMQRFGPSETNIDTSIDTVGFFIAKFGKKHCV